jgi:hypothetical protein
MAEPGARKIEDAVERAATRYQMGFAALHDFVANSRELLRRHFGAHAVSFVPLTEARSTKAFTPAQVIRFELGTNAWNLGLSITVRKSGITRTIVVRLVGAVDLENRVAVRILGDPTSFVVPEQTTNLFEHIAARIVEVLDRTIHNPRDPDVVFIGSFAK